jgi:hypothetical protein
LRSSRHRYVVAQPGKEERAAVPGTAALGGVATSISDKARGPTEETLEWF